MDHADQARELFLKGYNCAQALLCAYCDVTGLDFDTAARLASSFGGGLARLREVCGTVSGAAMVIGLAMGCSSPDDDEAKRINYRKVREFADRFRAENGAIVCRELLRGIETTPGGSPEARTPEYYRKRPCPDLVFNAARLLDEMLK